MSKVPGIAAVMQRAEEAFDVYKKVNAAGRATLLRTIATQIDALGDALILTASAETHLPEGRIRNEKGRTIGQLNAFAQLLEAGDWVQASIDHGDPERKPAPRPDLRKMLFPVGPVVVFGASNFPLAFSTAGGDTASALAAGCPVIVKSHPAHPKTSALVAGAIQQAIAICKLPEYAFQHVDDSSIEAGQQLVQHPVTKAVAFTGSYQGGKALFDLANKRPEPIPVFAEMGSVNPVVVLPEAIRKNKEIPSIIASSITLGVGQFCTNPGLMFVLEQEGLTLFLEELAQKISQASPAKMMHKGIAVNYSHRKKESLVQPGVTALTEVAVAEEEAGSPALAAVSAKDFLASDVLKEEVFGPYSLIVKCRDKAELLAAIKSLRGQLTATVFGANDELKDYAAVTDALHQRCGRLIFNGVPTGVEVCKSMQHGGPFPSTTDARFTSVGVDAIYRFVRPVAYQDFPDDLLPAELRNRNTLNILRCVNGTWTRD
jgi:alpha-ketoglutaric semialdehyde dehydrogenase